MPLGFPPLEWGAGSRLEGSANGTRVLFSGTLGDSGNLWEAGLTGAGTADGSLKRSTLGPGRQHQAAQVVIAGAPRTVFADLSLNYDIWSAPVGGIIRPVEAEV